MRLGDIPQLLKRRDVKDYLETSWALGWPMVLILLFDFAISLTDVFVAGRLGEEVQAAYGVVVQFYFIMTVVVTALNIGAVSTISKLFTADKPEEYALTVRSSLVVAGFTGIVLTGVGALAAPFFMEALSIPEAVKQYAVPLVRIYALGLVFQYILINANGVLRSTQRIQISLKTMSVVCFLNIGLNFALVFLTPLGFRGIGVATVISLATGALINGYIVRASIDGLKNWSWHVIKKIFRIGWPIGLLQLVWMFGQAVLYLILGALPEHPVEMMAAFTNGVRVEAAIFLPAFAFNFANAVVIGNMLGAKRYEDAYRNGIITAGIGMCVVAALTAIVVANAQWIMPLLSDNSLVIGQSKNYLYIHIVGEPIMAIGMVLAGGLNGAGDTFAVMWRVMASVWLVRIPLAYLCALVLGWGAPSIWAVMVVSITVHALLIVQRYRSRKWLRSA
jgi:MATE family multidrug resistance protein